MVAARCTRMDSVYQSFSTDLPFVPRNWCANLLRIPISSTGVSPGAWESLLLAPKLPHCAVGQPDSDPVRRSFISESLESRDAGMLGNSGFPDINWLNCIVVIIFSILASLCERMRSGARSAASCSSLSFFKRTSLSPSLYWCLPTIANPYTTQPGSRAKKKFHICQSHRPTYLEHHGSKATRAGS